MVALHRITGVLDLEKIRGKKLLFLGLGSLGSLTLQHLVYPGIQYVLADPDVLEEENVERHLLKARCAIGQPKVQLLRQWLIDAGVPPETIVTYQGPAQDILPQHLDADLAIINIDKRRYCDEINAFCHEHTIAAFYGGVYPKGTGGHVMAIVSPRDACYLCAQFMMGADSADTGQTEHNYGIDITQLENQDHDLVAVPALQADIAEIAAREAQLIKLFLQQPEQVPSHVLISVGNDWEPITVYDAVPTVLQQYCAYLPKSGFLPNARVCEDPDGTVTLFIRQGTMALALRRSELCSLHKGRVDLSDI